ncbi:alpha/beta hydrolase [Phototrophicus methaneseepsis]|uniref:Alpha/beta hydrolase n=1 Tax=Phototrophicus methaneseepsis TaxID=2710758 RepID=A0A7S8E7W8_9CHLR|nr:alpha/beta hydrolase [Phototrophicus methaneseepsis]QPC81962.1 alpha/beta hydrolase [Phototrophicus methaneseepsis]
MDIPTLDGITAKTVTSDRLTTRVLFSGPEDGIPVMFVHGNVSSATYWEDLMMALPAGYRGIAADNRGYGGADPSKKIDATRGVRDLSDDLAALMDALGIETAHVVGHSLGGSVLWQFMIDYPERIRTVTQAAPGSPYGFGGSKGENGEINYPDGAGSGAGIVNPEMVKNIIAQDRSADSPTSMRNVINSLYWKPPFKPAREEELLSSALSIHTGENAYPGDAQPSENWPMAAPGKFGPNNALAPNYQGDVSQLYAIDPKPPVLWIRGAEDLIVSDNSMVDMGALGQMGAVPGWPGADVFPPQPMVSQTRAVLEQYQASGGDYEEVVLPETGHSPYLEKPDEFNQHFHAHIQRYDA